MAVKSPAGFAPQDRNRLTITTYVVASSCDWLLGTGLPGQETFGSSRLSSIEAAATAAALALDGSHTEAWDDGDMSRSVTQNPILDSL